MRDVRIIGVDGDANGALGIIDFSVDNRCIIKSSTIVIPKEKIKLAKTSKRDTTRIVVPEFMTIMRDLVANREAYVGIETNNSRPGQSSQSTFNTGYNLGCLHTICELVCRESNVQYQLLYPMKWQFPLRKSSSLHSSDIKEIVWDMVSRILGTNDIVGPKGGKHTNKSDALGIALYILHSKFDFNLRW